MAKAAAERDAEQVRVPCQEVEREHTDVSIHLMFLLFPFFQAAADKKAKADADKRAAERKALLELAEARQRKVEEEQAAQQAQSAQDQMAADMAVSLSKGLMLSPFRMR